MTKVSQISDKLLGNFEIEAQMSIRDVFDASIVNHRRIDLIVGGAHIGDGVIDKTAACHRDEILLVDVKNRERVSARAIALHHKLRRVNIDVERQFDAADRPRRIKHRIAANALHSEHFGDWRRSKNLLLGVVFALIKRHASHHFALFHAGAAVARAARRKQRNQDKKNCYFL